MQTRISPNEGREDSALMRVEEGQEPVAAVRLRGTLEKRKNEEMTKGQLKGSAHIFSRRVKGRRKT